MRRVMIRKGLFKRDALEPSQGYPRQNDVLFFLSIDIELDYIQIKAGKMSEMTERDEAERIYSAVFKANIPPSLRTRFYEAANKLSNQ